MDYLPVSVNITDRNCLVVGGGNIALRKAKQLLKAGARVTAVSPEFHADFLQLESAGTITLVHSKYQRTQIDGQILIIAATDHLEINQQVYQDAEAKNILVNVVDQPALCRFIVPSIIDRSPLTVAISTGGSGPVFARMLREKLEWLIPNNIAEFLKRVNSERPLVAEKYPDMPARRSFWEAFFERQLNWSTTKNLSTSSDNEVDLKYQLFDRVNPNTQARLVLIDFGCSNVDDLSVAGIRQLQKVDDLYISHQNYQLIKDLVRRDADIHFIEKEFTEVELLSGLINTLTDKNTRTVIINSGHYFEQFETELLELMKLNNELQYERIGIAKYSALTPSKPE